MYLRFETSRQQGEARGFAWPRRMIWLPLATFVAAHAIVPRLFPAHILLVSLAFLIAAPLIAAAACWRRGRGAATQGWAMLTLALVLWAGGMVGNVLADTVFANDTGETRLSMLLFVLYGVPLIFTTASPESEDWQVRLVDGILALALGVLFFVHVFAYATMAGTRPDQAAYLRLMFDIENLFIAGFALLRFWTSRSYGDRDIYGTMSVFAVVYMVMAGLINHVWSDVDFGSPIDLVIDLPFLGLAALALGRDRPAPGARKASRGRERLVQACSPLMLPATLLIASATLLSSDRRWAVAGLSVATLVYGLRNALAHLRNLDERDRLAYLSQVDALTALPNRRAFDDRLQREWSLACRSGRGLALLMIDIDHFKLLNDSLGHPEGDRRLRQVAAMLGECATRASDLVARYGGEEFAAILPGTTAAQAEQLAEIMRAGVHSLDLATPAADGRVTISIGVGSIEPGRFAEDLGPEALLACADAALYAAKHEGRNRVRGRMLDAAAQVG
jgi:diguanylate cyclase (GGDEF)-like protein